MIKIFKEVRLFGAAAAVMLFVTACASAPSAPPESLNEAKLAIEIAERVDASHHAGAELDEARQKLEAADKAMASENTVMADRYANQSKIMAELATARTEAAKAMAVNAELNKGAKALTEEMQRTGGQQ
jgi:hypothetical protein